MWFLILVLYLFYSNEVKVKRRILENLKSENLIQIALSLNEYKDQYGQYPSSENWCDSMSTYWHNNSTEDLLLPPKCCIYSAVLNSDVFTKQTITPETPLIFGTRRAQRNSCFSISENGEDCFWVVTVSGHYEEIKVV
jgi:hypothetical protein